MGAGRFAPSPTGPLHLGNLRTALLAWLFARASGRGFLVRMEDLDTGRVREPWYGQQLDDLRSLRLDWDGEVVRQSERLAAYDEALAELDAGGLLYRCYCTRAEIRDAASAPHGPLPEGHYPGTCRELTAAQRAEREAAGRTPALRVRARAADEPFADVLHGAQHGVVDDFVVRRNDGAIAYQLAVVVDDAWQGIDQVVRGDDLIDSTPRQVWLGRALGLPEPEWAHVPLILGTDRTRVAKRHGPVTLAERPEGPDRVRSMLAASLGLAEPGEDVSPAQLVERFTPAALPRAASVLDDTGLRPAGPIG